MAQIVAVVSLVWLIVVPVIAIQDVPPNANDLMAYGFTVVAVTLLFSGSLTSQGVDSR